MKKLILGLTLLLGIGFSAPKAEAQYFYYSGVGAYYTGWGWYPTVNFGVLPYYGYSYYPYGFYPDWTPAPFAAISYSKSTGKTGFSYGADTKSNAIAGANQYCGQADCSTVVWVQGGCAAVAADETNSRLGWGFNTASWSAKSKAIQGCRHSVIRGLKSKCKIIAAACSGSN